MLFQRPLVLQGNGAPSSSVNSVPPSLHHRCQSKLGSAVATNPNCRLSSRTCQMNSTACRQMLCCSSLGASSAEAAAAPESKKQTVGVLFVCLGNICRSPTAEAVFKSAVEAAGLADQFDIDSCGTGGGSPDWFVEGGWSYHEGDSADARMSLAARKRGIRLTSLSRPLKPQDFTRFSYIIAMDPKNTRAIQGAADYWAARPMGQGVVPADYRNKLSLMTKYCINSKGVSEVPDPYYGGPEGFERVLDLLDDASKGLLQHIRAERGL